MHNWRVKAGIGLIAMLVLFGPIFATVSGMAETSQIGRFEQNVYVQYCIYPNGYWYCSISPITRR